MVAALKNANLALAFLLELCILAALGYWGFQIGVGPIASGVLGIGAPLLAAIIWGLLLAPKATVRVPGALHLVLKVVLFGLAVLALALAGRAVLATVFGVAALLNGALLFVWRQRPAMQ